MSIVKLRPHPADWWTLQDPVLKLGEMGYDLDTGEFKLGNGLSRWSELSSFVPGEDNGGSSSVQVASVPISSAEILALNVTPKVLLAAPGGRKYHVVHGVVLHYRFGTTPYVGDFMPFFGYGTSRTALGDKGLGSAFSIGAALRATAASPLSSSGLLAQTADAYYSVLNGSAYLAGQWLGWMATEIEDKDFVVAALPNGFVGDWDNAVTYEPGDVVADGADFYTANSENTDDEPLSANWDLLDSAGVTDGDGSLTVRVFYTTIDGAP